MLLPIITPYELLVGIQKEEFIGELLTDYNIFLYKYTHIHKYGVEKEEITEGLEDKENKHSKNDIQEESKESIHDTRLHKEQALMYYIYIYIYIFRLPETKDLAVVFGEMNIAKFESRHYTGLNKGQEVPITRAQVGKKGIASYYQ